MGSIFGEIVQRAEKLNADVRLGSASELRVPTATHSESFPTSSLLYAGLDDIFNRSEEIWSHKQSLRQVAGMGAALRTNKDLNQLMTTRLSMPTASKRLEAADKAEKPGEYDGITEAMAEGCFTDNEVDKYVQKAFERTRIEAERTFLNQQVLERPQSALKTFSPRKREQRASFIEGSAVLAKSTKHFATLKNTPLAHEQSVFAQKVDLSLSTDCTAPIDNGLKEAVKKLNSKEVDYIWTKVFSIFPKTSLLCGAETIRELRSSKRWLEHIIEAGMQHLQIEIEAHMESTIEANLARARRGGIPGTLSRIEAYLNVKKSQQRVYEDGLHGQHPKWAVIFYCLRVGDAQASSKIASDLFNNAQCSALVKIIADLPKLKNIDEDRRIKLRAEWKQNAQTCQDVHKKAVYGLFLGFDCPEANTTIEDWLWAKLFSCKYSVESTRALRQLQTTICTQHGEKYFVGEGGSHMLYYSVLLLTGQIERALYVLFKSERAIHSVHIGILAQQLHILLPTDSVSDEILTTDVHEASICQLNLARLVLLYVKEFELTNVQYALDYCFFLREFQLDAVAESKVSRNVFEACVSRIVYLTGEEEAILGQLNARGERIPGLIDKFAALSVPDVIARVAFDTNVQGDPIGACRLYALANRSDDAIRLISCQLAMCIASPTEKSTQKAVDCAEWLAQRYNRPNATEENALLVTLLLLLNLHAFFFFASEGKHQEAVKVIQELKFLPTDPEDVQTCVAQFHLVPDEVRPLLPDICAQLMRSIVALYAQTPHGSPGMQMFKHFAKALVLYTAMLPYRFPISTNSLLLQLQSKII